MKKQVVVFSHDMGSKLVLTTKDRYSMDMAAEILSWLEEADDCSIPDSTWKTACHGNLVEHGIHVKLGRIEFVVMCSYSELFISLERGSKREFVEFCEVVQQEFVTETPAS